MEIKAKVLQSFQHDRFYTEGETPTMQKIMFDDLKAVGLVVEASADTEAKPASLPSNKKAADPENKAKAK